MQPHGDMRLTNRPVSDLGNTLSKSGLTAGFADSFTKGFNVHKPDDNTASVLPVNTRSVFFRRQTTAMPKPGRETDFWKRLTLARTTCNPPKSMLQKDLVKEYDVSHQSAVTKWKTGGPDGTTIPRPEIVKQMAADAGVNFNWLFTGEGEMRSRPAPDPITDQILEALQELGHEGKIEVLKEAIAQKTLQLPAVSLRIKEAQRQAESKTKRKRA